MNYYEHHIGDYDEATAHLTACEDGIYSRMIRKYMATEKALPSDLKTLQRLVRARSKEEKEAVETILEEFFEQREDGWHQHRCDETIARYQDKQRKARASAEARWGAQRTQSDGNANASADAMRTHSEGNANQTPNTKHQSPEELTTANAVVVDSPAADLFLAHSAENPAKAKPDCPHQAIVALYHEVLPICPKVRDWTPARQALLRARWNEDPKRQNLDYWRTFFEYVGESEFLMGNVSGRDGRKPFVADLEWMLKPANFTKIREERYHQGAA